MAYTWAEKKAGSKGSAVCESGTGMSVHDDKLPKFLIIRGLGKSIAAAGAFNE